jgi:hypothetical protein
LVISRILARIGGVSSRGSVNIALVIIGSVVALGVISAGSGSIGVTIFVIGGVAMGVVTSFSTVVSGLIA